MRAVSLVGVIFAPFLFVIGQSSYAQQCDGTNGTPPWSLSSSRSVAAWPSAVIPRADGTILVCGGDKPVGGATRKCEIYDPSSNTWTLFPTDLPDDANFTSPNGVELDDGSVLIFQGSKNYQLFDGGTPLDGNDDFFVELTAPGSTFHPGSYEAQLVTPTLVMVAQRLSGRTYFYDVTADTWSSTNPGGTALNALDGTRTTLSTGTSPSKRLAVGDVAYQDLTTLTQERQNHVSAVDNNGNFYVGGGRTRIWDIWIYSRTTEFYDAANNQWTNAEPLPKFASLSSIYRAVPLDDNRTLMALNFSGISGISNIFGGGWYIFNMNSKQLSRICNGGVSEVPRGHGYNSNFIMVRGYDERIYLFGSVDDTDPSQDYA